MEFRLAKKQEFSVILNNEANESYQLVNWSREILDEKVLIIHVLAVSPKHSGKGLGTLSTL